MFMPSAPGASEMPKSMQLPSHLPQRSAGSDMRTPCPPSPGPSQVKTPPGKAHSLLLCCQFCPEPSLHSKVKGSGPGMLPSELRAEKTAEEVHARPKTEALELALEGQWRRAAREAEEVQGACPGPLHRACPCRSQVPVIQTSHRPASLPGNERSGTLGSEGCNLYIRPE